MDFFLSLTTPHQIFVTHHSKYPNFLMPPPIWFLFSLLVTKIFLPFCVSHSWALGQRPLHDFCKPSRLTPPHFALIQSSALTPPLIKYHTSFSKGKKKKLGPRCVKNRVDEAQQTFSHFSSPAMISAVICSGTKHSFFFSFNPQYPQRRSDLQWRLDLHKPRIDVATIGPAQIQNWCSDDWTCTQMTN